MSVGDQVIAACNVGSTTAGTGDESIGTLLEYTGAMTACATGYYLPSATDWSLLLQNGNVLGLWSGARNGSRITRTSNDLHTFADVISLPRTPKRYQTSTLTGGKIQQFVADAPTAGLTQTALLTDAYPVRCFQESSRVAPE